MQKHRWTTTFRIAVPKVFEAANFMIRSSQSNMNPSFEYILQNRLLECLFGLAKKRNPFNCNLSTIEADLENYDKRLTFKTFLSIGQASPTSFSPLCPTRYRKELISHKICLFTIFYVKVYPLQF